MITPAQLVVRNITSGGATGSPEITLYLESVTVNDRPYHVMGSIVDQSNRRGVGANRRTAEMGGGFRCYAQGQRSVPGRE